MAAQKRLLEDPSSTQKVKKLKTDSDKKKSKSQTTAPSVLPEEVDFPRGGGTSFTPLEVKTIRAEAVKEANEELIKVRQTVNSPECSSIVSIQDANAKKFKRQRRKSEAEVSTSAKSSEGKDKIRIEHLSYKVSSIIRS